MASFDDVLMGNLRGFRRETGQPLDEPAIRASAIPQVQPAQSQDMDDLRGRYRDLQAVDRPEYRGFKVPADMDEDQTDAWFASIDAREDAREAKEAEPFLTREPEEWESQLLEQIKSLNIAASKEEQRFLQDPEARTEAYKEFAGEVYEDVVAGDPETIRNVADVTSLTDPTGTSDLVSATQSARLAVSDPERRGTHLTDAAITGTAGGIQGIATVLGAAPLVGSLLSGARLKAAMRGVDVAEDVADVAKAEDVADVVPEPVFESVLERRVLDKAPNKISVDQLEGVLGRKKHPRGGQVATYTQDVKDKDTGKIVHKKGDKRLTKSGEEIVFPEYIYEGVSVGEWSDTKLDDFIDAAKASGKKSVSKDELIQHLEDNKVQIEEVRLGGAPPELKALQKDLDSAYEPVEDMVREFTQKLNDEGFLVENTLHHMVKDNPDKIFAAFESNAGALARRAREFANSAESRSLALGGDLSPTAKEVLNLLQSGIRDGFRTPMGYNRKQRIADIDEALSLVDAIIADARASGVKPSKVDQVFYTSLRGSDFRKTYDRMKRAESAAEELKNTDAFMDFEGTKGNFDLKAKEMEAQPPKWEEYTLPGGENYQEILLTAPNKIQKILNDPDVKELESFVTMPLANIPSELTPGQKKALQFDKYNALRDRVYERYGVSDDVEVIDWLNSLRKDAPVAFTDSHHSEIPNVMVHIRTKDRVDSKGRKILFVEEIQSDWHQKGRKHGYGPEDAIKRSEAERAKFIAKRDELEVRLEGLVKERDAARRAAYPEDYGDQGQSTRVAIQRHIDLAEQAEDLIDELNRVEASIENIKPINIGPPDAPMKDVKDWTALAIRRIFREAADGGYDGVAFTRGEDIAGIVGGVEKGQYYFYDKLIPSIAKKESFVPPERLPNETTKDYQERVSDAKKAELPTTDAGLSQGKLSDEDKKTIRDLRARLDDLQGDLQAEDFILSPSDPDVVAAQNASVSLTDKIEEIYKNKTIYDEPYTFLELTDKVKDKVIKPQKLYSVALPGIAVGAAAAEEEELSAAAALGALGLGGMALYKGAKGARAAKLSTAGSTDPHLVPKSEWKKSIDREELGPKVDNSRRYVAAIADEFDDLPSAMEQYGRDFAYEQPELVRKMTGIKPDDKVKIYRAISADDPAGGILPGDWVALDRSYAEMHGSSGYGDVGSKIVELEVPAKEIVWAGTSADEWHYAPLSARDNTVKSGHEAFVKDAIREGKEVPEEVLKDYPDLRAAAADVAKPPAATAGVSKSEVASAEKLAKKKTLACGDCFRYASKNAKEGDKVIHANVEGLEGPHAWIEREGRVFDWQGKQGVWYFQEGLGKEEYMQTGWPIDEFYKTFKPKDMVVYTEEEALINGVRAQNWGPWFPEERFAFGKATPHKPPAPAPAPDVATAKAPKATKEVEAISSRLDDFEAEIKKLEDDVADPSLDISRKRRAAVTLARIRVGIDAGFTLSDAEQKVLRNRGEELYESLFKEMGLIQRGDPEDAGQALRHLNVDGKSLLPDPYGQYIEDVGDLTHRMSHYAYDPIRKKVKDSYEGFLDWKGLSEVYSDDVNNNALLQYAFDNAKNHAGYTGSYESYIDALRAAGQKYADAHREVPVYNEVQRLANDAAIALGEFRFVDARDNLKKLNDYIKQGEDAFKIRLTRLEPEFARLGSAAAKPPAPASSKLPEEGNPAIDPPSLGRFPDVKSMLSVGGFGTLSSTRIATMQNEETGNPSVESGYNQSIDIGPVVEFSKEATEKSVRADGLYETMLMIEAEYTSLSKEDRKGKRGQVLENWYDQTSDEFTAAETVREQTEYDRYFRGPDFYYDTMPGGVEKYDDSRAFSIRAERGPKIVMDVPIREAQENEQRERFSQTMSNGAAAVSLFGSAGPMNRYLMNKAKAFNHPVQSVQLNFSEKVSLKEDISNVQDLHEAGLISFLLYKELIGDVELL